MDSTKEKSIVDTLGPKILLDIFKNKPVGPDTDEPPLGARDNMENEQTLLHVPSNHPARKDPARLVHQWETL